MKTYAEHRTVRIGPDEEAMARVVGSRRFDSCRAAGSQDEHYEHDESSEEQDWHAAGAEIAVGRFLDRWPTAFSSTGSSNKGADVAGMQVRSTTYLTGRLLIYEEDVDDQIFIHVVGTLPEFRITGWIQAGLVKVPERWTTRISDKDLEFPCHSLPQNVAVEDGGLRPFDDNFWQWLRKYR